MPASISKERLVLSKCWRAFRRKDLWFQNTGEHFKGKICAFKILAMVSKEYPPFKTLASISMSHSPSFTISSLSTSPSLHFPILLSKYSIQYYLFYRHLAWVSGCAKYLQRCSQWLSWQQHCVHYWHRL